MTTTTKPTRREKKQGGGVEGDGSSTSVTSSSSVSPENNQHKNPVHERGNLSYAEAHQYALQTHHQWVLDRLEAGESICFPWKTIAQIVSMVQYLQDHDPTVIQMMGWSDLPGTKQSFMELLPYDEQMWRQFQRLVPRAEATDCNGHPPALVFYTCPISEFKKRTPPLVEEI